MHVLFVEKKIKFKEAFLFDFLFAKITDSMNLTFVRLLLVCTLHVSTFSFLPQKNTFKIKVKYEKLVV